MAASSVTGIQSKGCLTTRIDTQTVVWCLGHLRTHVEDKVNKLHAAGFVNATGMFCQEQSAEEMKALLSSAPGSLFYVGGAMMKSHPELMADLLAFVEASCPTVAVEILGVAHFDHFAPGHGMPPTTEEVGQVSMLHVRSIADAWAKL